MHWLEKYDLFLFDFDGLLVDTEGFHYQAYQRLCAEHGIDLQWSFAQYCDIAHHHADALQRELRAQYPQLFALGLSWTELYQEKKKHYLEVIKNAPITLMPGVKEILLRLAQEKKPRAVVTHSPREQIEWIRSHHPILSSIPIWITRENYTNPKPSPDGYLHAIDLHKVNPQSVIGFEDSPRGFASLEASGATPVLVADPQAPPIASLLERPIHHYPDFFVILKNHFPT